MLTWVGRTLFSCPAKDFHCGLRGYRKEAFERMDLRTTGMEFASEMVIKANLLGMRIAEVPTTLSKDGRSRPPHLRPWRDGWRHLRFMLLFSPRWLFLFPGLLVTAISALAYIALLMGPVSLGRVTFDVHTMLYAQAFLILGILAVASGTAVRMFGMREGLLKEHSFLEKVRTSPALEIGGLIGIAMIALGLYTGASSLQAWRELSFGPLSDGALLRSVSFSTTLILVGGIVFQTSLILGFLSLPTNEQRRSL